MSSQDIQATQAQVPKEFPFPVCIFPLFQASILHIARASTALVLSLSLEFRTPTSKSHTCHFLLRTLSLTPHSWSRYLCIFATNFVLLF